MLYITIEPSKYDTKKVDNKNLFHIATATLHRRHMSLEQLQDVIDRD